MSIHVALNHVTRYRYDRRVALGPQVVRLRPAPHSRTRILAYSQHVAPEQHFINWQQDPFSNYLARLVFPEKTDHFEITVDVVAEMAVHNPFDFFLEPAAERFPFSYAAGLHHDLLPYLARSELTPRFRELVASIDVAREVRTVDFLVDLNQRLQRDIRYLIRMEPGVQTPEQTLVAGSGSCRDSGWLLVQLLRHLGLAARFVSGYLIQLKPDVKSLDGPSGTEVDFTDLHAWCEVYLPGAGWIGLDPTSGLLAGEGHIPLACTPEPSSAAPVEGETDECKVVFEHTMKVTRIYESPRVTKPYTDAQWNSVIELGRRVDAELDANDVRLTMGGEPTFVSIDDRDGAEWNTAALGPHKRGLATALLHRLRDRYGANGFVHFGQGKWYPGEQLPRWALSAYWRKDGASCWNDPALLADERTPAGHTAADAKRFIERLAANLQLDAQFVQAGFEDAWHYLWREGRLPINVDPFDARIDDELERDRLRRVFEAGLDAPVGYALPLARTDDPPAAGGALWTSGAWTFRGGRMVLVPGDSAMGYRLPLDALPWAEAKDKPPLNDLDPYADHAALPASNARQAAARSIPVPPRVAGMHPVAAQALRRFESAASVTRTALCVETRDGVLYVFMPPLADAAHYLELLAAIEATAAAEQLPVVLEGYPPPRDPRLALLQVTPDPGVIEVNIHPASGWDELVTNVEFLYDAAHRTRLSTEKFMLDGRHTGTGGGNHFVLGGATTADSPFLRRPDLLASLIGYWHNHPSLSYLFSGLFIGPTSQAPRVDEARNDQLYELEIAFAEIRRRQAEAGLTDQGLPRDGAVPPWLVDRTLRNILIDVTGNTHRSEFCIDKMYSPDGPTGRLGLLELRAFEMPPHARMSLTQQLLMRALVARFWKSPYTAPLARWGTQLHDRFLLPTFVAMDFEDVLAELADHGLRFDPQWFAPHLEFRFPLYGEVAARGIELSLRSALEPWHVMGEEGAIGGTVRYVDSSLERVEAKVTGLNDRRHVVTVNGIPLPLQPTGRAGEFAAGVRYRAWNPASALHPTIGVHTPLTFDIVDTWNQRSLGGCEYHVAHPGGRNYDTFPVNSYEAESRRLARFIRIGHTPGTMRVGADTSTQLLARTASHEFPFTLDLRRA